MADPTTSITKRAGGIDRAAFYRHIHRGVPYSEWAGRVRHGADLDVMRIDAAIRSADGGLMWPITDMAKEALALNPHGEGIVNKRLVPFSAVDWDLTPAEGDGLDPEEAKRIATDMRTMLKSLRGFRQAVHDLARGFYDGRAALETECEPRGKFSAWPIALHWIIPQRLSYGQERELIVVDRFSDSGQFTRRGPALRDLPGKFITFTPRMFGDLQEREGLGPRFIYWLFFDRLGWRHRLMLTEKFAIPWQLVESDVAKSVTGMKLPGREDGGEGSALEDGLGLDTTIAELDNLTREGRFVGLPGQKLHLEWPPAELADFFGMTSDQILKRLEVLTLHTTGTTTADGQSRAAAVVLKNPEDTLLAHGGALISEAFQHDLVNVLVELNWGADALPYAPTFQLRTQQERDRDKEIERLGKVSAAVPIGEGVWYEVSGFRAPLPNEALAQGPAPAGPFGAPQAGPRVPALPAGEGASDAATGALRDLLEDADEDDQADAADEDWRRAANLARWFAAEGRKVQPRSANGTPEVLVEKGVREGARHTTRWAEELVDAADGADAAKLYRNLKRAADSLDLEPFTRAVERRVLHGLMLGGLDADYEMNADAVIEPAEFAHEFAPAAPLVVPGVPAAKGIHDFVTKPFGEALRDFLARKVLPKRAFERLAAAAKRKAFTVAGLARKEMLTTAHDELSKALEKGADLREFSKALNERFDAAGWTRLNPSHVETVFRTNVMGAYGSGRRAQMTQPAVIAARPYWQWLGVSDSRTRPTHKNAIGKVLAANDPVFERIGPPAGFNCRCRLVSRSAADLKRLGLVPTIGAQLRGLPDEGWDAPGSGL